MQPIRSGNPQTILPDEFFKSTFALDYLTNVARLKSEREFNAMMRPVFGSDIPEHTYTALRNALLAGDIHSPHILLFNGGRVSADYDNRDRIIRIHVEAPVDVMFKKDPDSYQDVYLLVVLLHEFGHHIDNVLRQDLCDKDEHGMPTLAPDAPREEGSRFALSMLEALKPEDRDSMDDWLFHPDKPDELLLGFYSDLGYHSRPNPLGVNWEKALASAADIHGSPYHELKHSDPNREAFEAGGSDNRGHSHQTISWVLRDLGFKREEIDAVYFGNWLRDYSQVVDPKITRAPDMPKQFPAVLSRQAWTDLVDVLAVKKFADLRMRYPDQMRVTMDKLGVYRPTEHIDSPLVTDPALPDPRVLDPDFEPWVLSGDPILEPDRQTSMKRYISRSVDSMQQQLRLAMTGKRSLEGLRSFGAALHVLEDLFAHSNFTELSLIKAGHVRVLPWTTPARVKWNLPLVTGTFGGSDVIASLAAPLGKILFSTVELEFELTQPGYRSERDKVMLILLSEHPNQTFLEAFNALLVARDGLITLAKTFGLDTLKFYRCLMKTPAAILLNAYNSAAQGVLTWIGNSVDDAQTLLGGDPNTDASLEPSHSQLAKDHAEHPLHDLAALLATEAVRQVAQAMVDHWDGKPDADPVATATAFFCHPADTDWQYDIVNSWAAIHPEQVVRAESKSELDQTHQHAIEELRDIQAQMTNASQQFLDYLFNSPDEEPSTLRGQLEKLFMEQVSNTAWWKALQNIGR